MRVFSGKAGILALGVVLFAIGAMGAVVHRTPTPAATRPAEHVVGPNALLPAHVNTASLMPELGMVQKTPMGAVEGFDPVYSDIDWAAYRQTLGTAADAIGTQKAAAQLAFAQRMMADATGVTERKGLYRLLMMRAVAVAYRNKEGGAVVAQALAQYQAAMDRDAPLHVAALWQMADAVARQAATPREARSKYSLLAAKANVQLAMLLLDGGQVQTAQEVIKMLGRHEAAIKLDPVFKSQASNARTLVGQTVVLMDEMAAQIAAFEKGDQNAPMRLYLYGKFAARTPLPAGAGLSPEDVVRRILEAQPRSAAAALDQAVERAKGDVKAAFDAGELLKAAAAGLPDGIVKHRVLNAAREDYAAYLKAAVTDEERVNRTRSRIAMEAVVSDGASASPHIRPLEPPPSTQPGTQAASQPATRR